MGERETGFVYFIQGKDRRLIKIGWSIDPKARLRQLECGSPEPLELVGALRGSPTDERRLHQQFALQRVRGEWFRVTREIRDLMEIAAATWGKPVRTIYGPNGGPLGPV